MGRAWVAGHSLKYLNANELHLNGLSIGIDVDDSLCQGASVTDWRPLLGQSEIKSKDS